jgi:Methyltransferase domain
MKDRTRLFAQYGLFLSASSFWEGIHSFGIIDYTHYLDYLPLRQEGLANFESFRTAGVPPTQLRNRKMEIGPLKLEVEDVLTNPTWPAKWPYSFEDFRPCDYTRDEPVDTLAQYQYSQSLIDASQVMLIPGVLRFPIRRHFILPKDKIAQIDHLSQYLFDGATVLELFSTYESVLPKRFKLGPTVGVGWSSREMVTNPRLDDFIEQDLTVDPFLPLADNYFDFVVVPAMFQLFQRPLDMFREINRVLKPGGTAIIGVKLAMWSFLTMKQCRYYVETNYLEDMMACGSFFHYAGGFSKPKAFDLNLPEVNPVGKVKDALFPQPRLEAAR